MDKMTFSNCLHACLIVRMIKQALGQPLKYMMIQWLDIFRNKKNQILICKYLISQLLKYSQTFRYLSCLIKRESFGNHSPTLSLSKLYITFSPIQSNWLRKRSLHLNRCIKISSQGQSKAHPNYFDYLNNQAFIYSVFGHKRQSSNISYLPKFRKEKVWTCSWVYLKSVGQDTRDPIQRYKILINIFQKGRIRQLFRNTPINKGTVRQSLNFIHRQYDSISNWESSCYQSRFRILFSKVQQLLDQRGIFLILLLFMHQASLGNLDSIMARERKMAFSKFRRVKTKFCLYPK